MQDHLSGAVSLKFDLKQELTTLKPCHFWGKMADRLYALKPRKY